MCYWENKGVLLLLAPNSHVFHISDNLISIFMDNWANHWQAIYSLLSTECIVIVPWVTWLVGNEEEDSEESLLVELLRFLSFAAVVVFVSWMVGVKKSIES